MLSEKYFFISFYIMATTILPKWLTKKQVCLSLFGILVLLVATYFVLTMYSKKKVTFQDSMSNRAAGAVEPKVKENKAPSPLLPGEEYAKVKDINTSTQGLPPSCNKEMTIDPKELLPKDSNSEWAKLNPTGNGDLSDVNLLKAGHHIGINTVGQSLRNANQQLRSDPPVPQMSVGPWNNTTIEPDLMRVPLELGAKPSV